VTTRPKYNGDGQLELPLGYRSWAFVGANLSPEYNDDPSNPKAAKIGRSVDGKTSDESDQFHNIYINRESYEYFIKKCEFLDPTILVMELFKAEQRDAKGILKSGKVEGRREKILVAVKDSKRPKGGVPWAYYSFDVGDNRNSAKPAIPHPDEKCYQCHLDHASKDNVWVQFYPALRDPE
jgi:hypothetical protein